MKCLLFLLSFLLCWNALSARTWTDHQGRTFDGEYVSADVDEVRVIRSVDGAAFTLQLDRLSRKDQDFVCEQLGLVPLHIDSSHGGGAFGGQVDAYWTVEDDQLKITVRNWRIRFRCHDQIGRELAEIYFEFAADKDGGWSTGVKSNRLVVRRYICAGEPIELKNLEFSIDLNQLEKKGYDRDDLWFVGCYRSSAGGHNFGHADTYAFSGEPRK